ncbi:MULTISPECIES: AAA family ATPase [unclassified Flavobacterium]|jgi:DNA replication protein DnaC|uniref:AAA family ATPase n=1 Tax=unclassified Flavobacterium TaxID=196869 RepID=UPI0025C0F3D4|nr:MULTISPECIES: AAA family ATPase [unclassified Flavobacterium]
METLNKDSENNQELFLQNTNFGILDSTSTYVDCFRMYLGYYNKIPNFKSLNFIDIDSFKNWFENKYENQIIKQHYKQRFDSPKKELKYIDHFYILKQDLMLNVERNSIYILYTNEQETTVNVLFEECKKFIKIPKKTTDISLIIAQNGSLETKEVHIKKPKIDFNIHYNEDFFSIHKSMVKQLNKKDTNGLYLFHGQPGTGKSTYIKYLIHQLKKKVIFISPKMAGELDNLSMTPFLLENRNSVLVIEDAEELITSREEVRNSNLSMLLNLTDGLLGESLGIQIIATFNTDVKNIDKALLRKGRLSIIYEFKPLALDRTNALLNKLGHIIEVAHPLSAADIFNFEISNNYEPKLRKAVGFGN